jgi:hypothetical protein
MGGHLTTELSNQKEKIKKSSQKLDLLDDDLNETGSVINRMDQKERYLFIFIIFLFLFDALLFILVLIVAIKKLFK